MENVLKKKKKKNLNIGRINSPDPIQGSIYS